MKRFGFIFYLLVSALILTSCASTGFLMAKAKVTLFGDSYSPKSEDANIDIYMTNKPTQEYLEFAQITCRDTNDKWSLDQIIIKARKIGADGIIIIGKAGTSGVGIPMGTSTYVVTEDYGMTAVAIKYK
jgi:hypothetical protein